MVPLLALLAIGGCGMLTPSVTSRQFTAAGDRVPDQAQPGAADAGIRVVGFRDDGRVDVMIDDAMPLVLPPDEWVDLALRPNMTLRRVMLLGVDPARDEVRLRYETGEPATHHIPNPLSAVPSRSHRS